MRRVLQVVLAAGGVSAILISLLHVLLGPSCIPGSIPVNATMDSEDRFYATIFAAYGVALLWCVKDVEKKARQVKLLALVFFLGGLVRIVSMLAEGLPHSFFIAMTLLELCLPLAIWFMVWRVSQVAHAEPRAAPDRVGHG
jgi:hypothetical protein